MVAVVEKQAFISYIFIFHRLSISYANLKLGQNRFQLSSYRTESYVLYRVRQKGQTSFKKLQNRSFLLKKTFIDIFEFVLKQHLTKPSACDNSIYRLRKNKDRWRQFCTQRIKPSLCECAAIFRIILSNFHKPGNSSSVDSPCTWMKNLQYSWAKWGCKKIYILS